MDSEESRDSSKLHITDHTSQIFVDLQRYLKDQYGGRYTFAEVLAALTLVTSVMTKWYVDGCKGEPDNR